MVKESMYTPQTLHRRLIWGVGQEGEGNVQTYRLPFYGFRPRLKVTRRTKKRQNMSFAPKVCQCLHLPSVYIIPTLFRLLSPCSDFLH